MKTQSFKDLIVWQKAHKETVNVYQEFSPIKDFGFRDQIQRASVSVMNNIAEGYARRSDKAFIHFLRIAKGSNTEVESMLILAGSLHYISSDTQKRLLMGNEEIGKLLSGFIYKLSAEDY